MYLELKKTPLWPSKEVIQSNLPLAFTKQYPRTRVIMERAMERIKNFHIFDSYISQMYWQGSIKNMKIGQHTTNKK